MIQVHEWNNGWLITFIRSNATNSQQHSDDIVHLTENAFTNAIKAYLTKGASANLGDKIAPVLANQLVTMANIQNLQSMSCFMALIFSTWLTLLSRVYGRILVQSRTLADTNSGGWYIARRSIYEHWSILPQHKHPLDRNQCEAQPSRTRETPILWYKSSWLGKAFDTSSTWIKLGIQR